MTIASPADLEALDAVAEPGGPLLVDVRINGDVVNPAGAQIAAAVRGRR